MYIPKHSSLHLNWVSRKSKQTITPKVAYIEGHEEYGGFYVEPSYYPYIYEGIEIPCEKGIIFAVDDDTCRATIAHEWRHHWQKLNGWDLNYSKYNYVFSDPDIYDREIIRFFTDNDFEMDALMFEYTHAMDWSNTRQVTMLKVAL